MKTDHKDKEAFGLNEASDAYVVKRTALPNGGTYLHMSDGETIYLPNSHGLNERHHRFLQRRKLQQERAANPPLGFLGRLVQRLKRCVRL